MGDTIFSRIVRGEIPCHRVYQDEHVLAFLDINPISRGHTLIVTKEPAATMDELSESAAAGLGRALPKVCKGVLRATGASGYNLLQNNGGDAGQEVMHVHVHVIPRYGREGEGLRVVWPKQSPTGEELAELGRQIARAC